MRAGALPALAIVSIPLEALFLGLAPKSMAKARFIAPLTQQRGGTPRVTGMARPRIERQSNEALELG